MRIRASHIAGFVVILIVGFVFFALMETGNSPSSAESKGAAPTAALPPVGKDDQVAKIEFETTDFSLGLIANDKIASGKLKVFNRGKAPLTIGNIKTSCGCTQGTIPPERATIAPGGETWIDVSVDPKRVPAFESHKVLTVYSNDPAQPAVSIKVASQIDPEFDVPAIIDFGDVAKGVEQEKTVTLRQIGATPIEVQAVEELTPDPGKDKPKPPANTDIAYSFKKLPDSEWKTPGKAEFAITAKLTGAVPPGALSRYVTIATNCPRLPKYRVQVKGNITTFYKVSPAYPERVVMHLPDGGKVEKGAANIESAQPIEITDLKFDATKIDAKVRKGDTANLTHIDVETTPDCPRGRLDEEITFTVKSPKETFTDKIAVRAYVTRIEK